MEDSKKETGNKKMSDEVRIAIVKGIENILTKLIECYFTAKTQKKDTPATPES